MANFASAATVSTTLQVAIKVFGNHIEVYTTATGTINFNKIEHAIAWLRDNTAPVSITGAAHEYDIQLIYYPNTLGNPWSEQGGGMPGPYNG